MFDAAMRRAGVLRIRDFGQLYSAASTLGAGVRMRGRRLGIVTNAGGPGQLAADRAGDRWLPVARLDDATLAQLRALLPPSTAEGNPVYVRGDASAQVYAQAAQACLQDGEVDALLAILTPFALTDADRFATELIAVATAQRKPVFTCWMGGAAVTAARQRFAENRVPTFPTPEAAVDAIAALALFTANQEQLLQVPAPLGPTSTPDRATAQRLLDAARAAGNEWLNPADSKELLAAFGIPIVRSRPAYSADEAVQVAEAIGYPVAMKILSPDIAHKTDVGGVRLGRTDARSVHDGYENMLRDVAIARPDARLEGVLIEPMYVERHGRELMIGAVRDPVFGPAISFGLGGTMVEVIRDRAVALPPLNPYLARDLIRRTRASLALAAAARSAGRRAGSHRGHAAARVRDRVRIARRRCDRHQSGDRDCQGCRCRRRAHRCHAHARSRGDSIATWRSTPIRARSSFRSNCRTASRRRSARSGRRTPNSSGTSFTGCRSSRGSCDSCSACRTSRRRCCPGSRRSTTTASWP